VRINKGTGVKESFEDSGAEAQKGPQQPSDRLEIKIWIIDFMSRECIEEEMI
jgi:hypothetical protein